MGDAKVESTGIYVPSETMSNEEFEERTHFKIDPYYSEQIGINHRHLSSEEETPAYMAAEAGKMALERASMEPGDLDLIILGTDTPEVITPPTAIKAQYLLGGRKEHGEYEVPAFDVDASCANGALLLDIASRYIRGGGFENVLVLGTYAMTKFLFWKYKWEALFSDGAGAVLLTETDEHGHVGGLGRSDGSWWYNWGIYMGTGTMDIEGFNQGLHKLDLRSAFPAEVNEEGWPTLVNLAKDKFDIDNEDIGMIFFTQVRRKSIEIVMDKLELPMEKTHTIMEKYGYTGSACVYQALHDAFQEGKMDGLEGKKVIFMTSGVGYTQYLTVFDWI